jgi:hypothetical protein
LDLPLEILLDFTIRLELRSTHYCYWVLSICLDGFFWGSITLSEDGFMLDLRCAYFFSGYIEVSGVFGCACLSLSQLS